MLLDLPSISFRTCLLSRGWKLLMTAATLNIRLENVYGNSSSFSYMWHVVHNRENLQSSFLQEVAFFFRSTRKFFRCGSLVSAFSAFSVRFPGPGHPNQAGELPKTPLIASHRSPFCPVSTWKKRCRRTWGEKSGLPHANINFATYAT